MISVDVYNADTCTILGTFELKFDQQYTDLIMFEDSLTEKGIKYIEITTYQED
jgi:hypothetical protein